MSTGQASKMLTDYYHQKGNDPLTAETKVWQEVRVLRTLKLPAPSTYEVDYQTLRYSYNDDHAVSTNWRATMQIAIGRPSDINPLGHLCELARLFTGGQTVTPPINRENLRTIRLIIATAIALYLNGCSAQPPPPVIKVTSPPKPRVYVPPDPYAGLPPDVRAAIQSNQTPTLQNGITTIFPYSPICSGRSIALLFAPRSCA